ncbi:glycosyltransferase family 2 protein [Brachyspira intermedia]|uniref:glycosyltransferase family 2 protein n=1 Tax=Brachyspira intermedia TaxID=84377 RepID=UPI003005839D
MSNKELISIILPVYNAEKYIGKCLRSLINQTYDNIEILCINDGSKDNSYNILKKYSEKDNRIKVFTQENSGSGKARNVGLDNAYGDYIMFCDSDDQYRYNMCELMLSTIVEQKSDLVMCDCNIFNYLPDNVRDYDELKYYSLKLIGEHNINESTLLDINIVVWNKIYKKSIIDKYKVRFLENIDYEDANFIFKYLLHSKIYYGLNVKLYDYNVINMNSMMVIYYTDIIKKTNKVDFVYVNNDIIRYYIDNHADEKILQSFMKYYISTSEALGKYLNIKDIKKLIQIQKNFFNNIDNFDDIPFINTIKTKSLKNCIKLYYPSFTFLELIFSIKKKNYSQKIITILGFHFTINKVKY